jgi:hypothetical protein
LHSGVSTILALSGWLSVSGGVQQGQHPHFFGQHEQALASMVSVRCAVLVRLSVPPRPHQTSLRMCDARPRCCQLKSRLRNCVCSRPYGHCRSIWGCFLTRKATNGPLRQDIYSRLQDNCGSVFAEVIAYVSVVFGWCFWTGLVHKHTVDI